MLTTEKILNHAVDLEKVLRYYFFLKKFPPQDVPCPLPSYFIQDTSAYNACHGKIVAYPDWVGHV